MNPVAFFVNAKPATVATTGTAVVIADLMSAGGVIVGVIGVAVAAIVAFFTIRNLQRSYWRNLVDERDAEIIELKRADEEKLAERARFAEEQREVRHRLKNEVAESKKQLELERAKSDLTTVFSRITSLEQTLKAREPLFEDILNGIHNQTDLLTQMLAQLKKNDLTEGGME